MKNKIIIKSLLFIFLCLSSKVNAELIFKNDFPVNMQGAWSTNCSLENQIFIISFLAQARLS
mgnify:CR=1 FL=1